MILKVEEGRETYFIFSVLILNINFHKLQFPEKMKSSFASTALYSFSTLRLFVTILLWLEAREFSSKTLCKNLACSCFYFIAIFLAPSQKV